MINEIQKDAQARMTKSIEALRHDLVKVRTGRATTALVDHLKVNYYGSDVPLSTFTVSRGALADEMPASLYSLPVV